MNEVFDLLAKRGLTTGSGIESVIMRKWTIQQILDFNQGLVDKMKRHPVGNPDIASFSFVPNSNISAQTSGYCDVWDCRLERVDRLARFGAMYCDRVYVENYFDKYSGLDERVVRKFENSMRYHYTGDLKLLLGLRPVLESGIVSLITPLNKHLCASCMGKEYPPLSRLVSPQLLLDLERRYLGHVSAELAPIHHGHGGVRYDIDVHTPDDIVPHGFVRLQKDGRMPAWLQAKVPPHGTFLDHGVPLTKSEIRKLGVLKRLLKTAIDDCVFQHLSSRISDLNAKYLTDRSLDSVFLDEISMSDRISGYNALLRNKLLYELPILRNVSLNTILEIRRNEQDTFFVYRSAIDTVVKDYISQGRPLSDRDAQQIYDDIIFPKLCKLNVKVDSIRSSLQKKLVQRVLIVGTVATLGIVSGVLPSTLQAVIAGVGGIQVVKDLVETAATSLETPADIRNDNMYFLWRLTGEQR